MAISPDVLRVGKKYYLTNFSDHVEFIVLEYLSGNNYKLKDIHTLEIFELDELLQFGKGENYDMGELNDQ